MAKKTTEKYSFAVLNNALSKINPDGSILAENEYAKIENYISLGNYILNAQVSGSMFKGIPEGRITMLAGESGTGKTFLSLNILKEAQKENYDTIWIDTENAMDNETMERFNIDTKKVSYQPIDTVESLTTFLANLGDNLNKAKESGKELPKILVIIDSLGNLSTRKEMGDALSGSEKADMTRTRELKKLFRVCTKKLGLLRIPIVVTNHTYQMVGSFIPQRQVSGGSGPFYNSHIILELTKAQLKEKANEKTGIIVTSKVIKSRLTRSGINIKFYISFINGMNPYVGLQDQVEWDLCGMGPGKLDKDNKYDKDISANPKYYAVEHLKKHIKNKNIFTADVFSKRLLNKLDKKLQQTFGFPDPTQIQNQELEMITKNLAKENPSDVEITDKDKLIKS